MRPLKNMTRQACPSSGFTLIEMAMVIMILGIIIAGFSPAYKAYQDNAVIQTTQNNIDNISAAIGSFRAINGRYPCPASLTAVRGDANYGREDCTNYNGVVNPGTCDTAPDATGICREQSERAVAYMDPFTVGNPTITANPTVRVGGIPFRELNLEEKQAYDGYDNRVMYAVTENMMFDNTFRANQGGIEIVDNEATPISILTPPASAHFLVFSYGKNGNGAFSRAGTRFDCPIAGPEKTNCDVAVNSRYSETQINTSTGNTQYDDVMTYFTQSEVPLWQLSTQEQGAIVQKPGGDVGMAFTAASTFNGSAGVGTKTAQINGVLRATDDATTPTVTEGQIMSNSLCTDSGPGSGDCFNTALIEGAGGAGNGMKCPDDDPDGVGAYMVGVTKGHPICEDDATIQCGAGEIMTGIDANGQITCANNSSCGTETVSLCGTDWTLAAGPNNTTRTVGPAGLTATQTFKCQNKVWKSKSSAGVCTCTPQSDQTNNNTSCGVGFTGTFTQTRSYVCPTTASPAGTMPYWTDWVPPAWTNSDTTWTYPATSPCNCVGKTESRNTSCDSGEVASIPTQTRTFACSGAKSGTWSDWTPPFTCTCVPKADQTQFVACGGNYPAGSKKKQQRSFISCPNNWTNWTDIDVSACVCTPWSETHTNDPCPSGQIGAVTNRYDYACPSGVTVTKLSSTCAPPPPVVCSWSSNDYVGSSTTAAGPRIGTTGSPACSCGDTKPQCNSGSTGNFQIYQNCVCGN